jgi:ABC-type amino acid transport substrate-binding protein
LESIPGLASDRWALHRRRWLTLLGAGALPLSARAEDLRVFVPGFPPLLEEREGQASGPLIGWFKRIEALTGDHYNLELMPWMRALEQAKRGGGAVWGISYTEERATALRFSRPTYHVAIHLVALKGSRLRFHSVDDLRGLRIAVIRGASYGAAFDQAGARGQFERLPEARQSAVLRLVLEGRADAAVITGGTRGLQDLLRLHPDLTQLAGLFEVLPEPVVRDPIYLAIPRQWERTELLERFDAAVERIGPVSIEVAASRGGS